MCSRNVPHGWLPVAAIVSLLPISACGGSSPAPEQGTPASAQTAPVSAGRPADASLPAGASPAPGSERFDPDPHPELAHLTEVTLASLTQSVTNYVQAESARHGGVFPVNDPEQRASLELTLMTVHRERLSKLADGRYFACADFKGRDGRTYDIDIFMRQESTGLTPTSVIVHKQDGKPRFNWVEQDSVWSPAPVASR